MTTPLRLPEEDARTLLLVQAVEEADRDGVLLSPQARAAATRRVFDDPAGSADDSVRLRTRALVLRDDLRHEAPALERLLHPPRWRGPVVAVAVAAAATSGALTNALGPARHVSVLAFPLAGILAWNLLVYAALVARRQRRGRAGGDPRPGAWPAPAGGSRGRGSPDSRAGWGWPRAPPSWPTPSGGSGGCGCRPPRR